MRRLSSTGSYVTLVTMVCVALGPGPEWFLTSPKFLDRIARTLGLEVRVINDFAINEER